MLPLHHRPNRFLLLTFTRRQFFLECFSSLLTQNLEAILTLTMLTGSVSLLASHDYILSKNHLNGADAFDCATFRVQGGCSALSYNPVIIDISNKSETSITVHLVVHAIFVAFFVFRFFYILAKANE